MRSQCGMEVALPIPVHIPAQFALEYLQANAPALTQVCEDPVFEELPPDPALIADDSFFGPWDENTRLYNISGPIYLAPGLKKAATWSAVYQLIPDGVRLRGVVNAGVVSWTKWTIRRRQDGTGSESSSPGLNIEEWELYGEVMIEAHNLLMPFASLFLRRVIRQLGERAIDGLVQTYYNNTT